MKMQGVRQLRMTWRTPTGGEGLSIWLQSGSQKDVRLQENGVTGSGCLDTGTTNQPTNKRSFKKRWSMTYCELQKNPTGIEPATFRSGGECSTIEPRIQGLVVNPRPL